MLSIYFIFKVQTKPQPTEQHLLRGGGEGEEPEQGQGGAPGLHPLLPHHLQEEAEVPAPGPRDC